MGTPGLLPTTLVGSYPQPGSSKPDDATLLALRDFELAGIDIVTDGEIRLARRRVLTAAPPPRLRLRRR
jgi:methionine synthase II (cobalamin-independent)